MHNYTIIEIQLIYSVLMHDTENLPNRLISVGFGSPGSTLLEYILMPKIKVY